MTNLHADRQLLFHDCVERCTVHDDDNQLTYGQVLDRWNEDITFCDFFGGLLAQSRFSAFRWETPPWRTSTLDQPFEFVLIDSPELDQPAEASPFEPQFESIKVGSVVSFENLRRDAMLVVPRPTGSLDCYGHLAAFVRLGPPSQVSELWQTISSQLNKRLGSNPIWLSTAGMGVQWLHVRLDSRPKYYAFEAYRRDS